MAASLFRLFSLREKEVQKVHALGMHSEVPPPYAKITFLTVIFCAKKGPKPVPGPFFCATGTETRQSVGKRRKA